MALEGPLCYNPEHMATNEYLPTIGIEIHAELNTKTKMFCSSKNDAAEKRPNINVCPVCMAHPGTLPVINKAAVEHVLRVGTALGSKLADYTEFDRKNYFYPDLPKGYQLSQYEYPLVSGGTLNGVKLTRIHLEEDTASSVHDENSGATLVDYNRAGVPLMELVTEPVLHSAEEAGNFGRELQLLLRYLGASEADMEKGQMRLEANISVAKMSPEEIAARKNIAENNKRETSDNKQVNSDNANKQNNSSASEISRNKETGDNSQTISKDSSSSNQNNLAANGNATDASIDANNIPGASSSVKDSTQKSSSQNIAINSSRAADVARISSLGAVNDLSEKSSAEVLNGTSEKNGVKGKDTANKENRNAKNNELIERSETGSPDETGANDEASDAGSSNAVDYSKLGTKVEVKNINSFRAMERAIQYEIKRQIGLLERGEKVVQETRGWDENKQITFSQRIKEGSADYRYFPDPDLPSLKLTELGLTRETMEKTLPELPWQRRERYRALGISAQDVDFYVKDSLFGGFFEAVSKELGDNPTELKLASNYIANDLVSLIASGGAPAVSIDKSADPASMKAAQDQGTSGTIQMAKRDVDIRDTERLDKMPISATNFAKLVKLAAAKKISSRSAKDILAICLDGVSDPEVVAKDKNLLKDGTGADIAPVVAKIIADNPTVAADFRGGKAAALEYLVGQGMKALRGATDPISLREEIKKQLS
jgi:Asp-tRNA(Asn)/Glu-tRNA(Gln) amidotransferase B subunit